MSLTYEDTLTRIKQATLAFELPLQPIRKTPKFTVFEYLYSEKESNSEGYTIYLGLEINVPHKEDISFLTVRPTLMNISNMRDYRGRFSEDEKHSTDCVNGYRPENFFVSSTADLVDLLCKLKDLKFSNILKYNTYYLKELHPHYYDFTSDLSTGEVTTFSIEDLKKHFEETE